MTIPMLTRGELVRPDELFTSVEELALSGFLAGYSGLTREAYTLDLRQYAAWCTEQRIRIFGARRADIETFGRHLETLGRARATVSRRLCTITCFYRYAEQEGLIEHSPAVHVRRPRLDYESHATGLAGARDHALISLLALNGLRISEATGADVDKLGLERGHRTLTILRKGGKTVTIPMAPRTARAIDLAVGERCEGPIFLGNNGERLDRHAAARSSSPGAEGPDVFFGRLERGASNTVGDGVVVVAVRIYGVLVVPSGPPDSGPKEAVPSIDTVFYDAANGDRVLEEQTGCHPSGCTRA